jgi:amidohydrolase
MDIFAQSVSAETKAETIEMRRHFHRRPELSGVEFETLEYIKKRLDGYGVGYIEVPDGGILACVGSPEDTAPTVLLRADIDALPIRENPRNLKRPREVVSLTDGVQHACGHDAHTSMLLSAARLLHDSGSALEGGRVLLLFERGEEGNGNIRHIIRYLLDKKVRIDAAHAIHVRPDLPSGA